MPTGILVGVLLAVLVCGAIYLHWVHVAHRLTVVCPGRVYQSAAMPPGRLLRAVRRLEVDTVIDFRGATEMPLVRLEKRILEAAGLRHANVPSGALPSDLGLRHFLAIVREELAANRRILIHCKDGEGRAVAFAAVYRMELEGWSPIDAYRATTRLPPTLRFITWFLPFAGRLSRSNAKSRMILSYVAPRSRTSRSSEAGPLAVLSE